MNFNYDNKKFLLKLMAWILYVPITQSYAEFSLAVIAFLKSNIVRNWENCENGT